MSEVVFVELHWKWVQGGDPRGYAVATLENAKSMVDEFNAKNDGFVHWWQPRKAPNKASTRTAGTVRKNSKSKSKKVTVKSAGSPSRR